MKKERLRDARRLALVCAGATVMALNIKSFVRVGGLYPGGFNGLTLLLQAIFSRFLGVELPFTLINLLLNSVPIVISFLFIGKKFTLFSCVTIVLSSVLTDTLPGYPLTNDPLLISVFGGIINALGISLCLSTYWLTILTGSPFLALLPTRIVQNLNMIPIQFIVLRLMQHPVTLYLRRAQHA